jgi:hypothetical protein
MKIDVITMWYNEEFLAPFFLGHYSFADTIHILLDEETTDNTRELISKFKNVNVIPVRFPDMLDDLLKVEKINGLYRSIRSDWVIVVDSDEFLFSLPLGETFQDVLGQETTYNLFNAQMWQVYRHRSDADLDPNLPAIYQRRHGDPNVSSGINATYVKPVIIRSNLDIQWLPGCHELKGKRLPIRLWDTLMGKRIIPSPRLINGTHWQMADPDFAVARRLRRKSHLSKRNRENSMGTQHFYITEQQIREECDRHRDDPLLF